MRAFAWRFLAAAVCSLAVSWAADYSTFIGDANDYRVARIAADSAGNTYLTGGRFPVSNPWFSQFSEIFVMKLDAAGKIALFATLSGKGIDEANDLALDAAGNIYIAGATSSQNFPLHNAFQSAPGPGFLVKLSPDASQLIFSTYFPAPINALALDPAGNLYVTGSTNSAEFPVTGGLPAGTVSPNTQPAATSGAFITKLSAAGDRILYSARISGHQKNCGAGSSCFLSSRYTAGVAIAVDPSGSAYVAGNTDTVDLPVTPGALLAAGTGAFVAKVNPAGNALTYLTYLGPGYVGVLDPNPANWATAIAADAVGNAYVAGYTSDPKFPATRGAYQTTFAGHAEIFTDFLLGPPPPDAFVLKLNPAGSAVLWGSYLGGKAADAARSIALDSAGNVWVNGVTASPEFPNQQGWSQGADFVVAFNPSGSALSYASRFPNDTASASLAVDAAGMLHFAGSSGLVFTLSPKGTSMPRIFGIANAAHGPVTGRLVPGEVISIYGPHIGPSTPAAGVPDSIGFMPKSLGGVQVAINGNPIPLLYVSDSQINAVVPLRLGGQTATVRVNSAPDFTATVISAAPEIFQHADGTVAAVNQDGAINGPDHPAKAGSAVSIWVTGIFFFDLTTLADGHVTAAAIDYACCQVYFNSPAEVLYAGAAPGTVAGVVQINFRVPIPNPFVTLSHFNVLSGTRFSSPVQIYVAQ